MYTLRAKGLTMFCSTIESYHRNRNEPCHGARNYDPSARWLVDLAEHSHGLPTDVGGTPEVGLEHRPQGLIRRSLDFSDKTKPSVVENDVNSAKGVDGLIERLDYLLWLRNIELQDKELVRAVFCLEVTEYLRLARRSDYNLALLQDMLRRNSAETAGGTSD